MRSELQSTVPRWRSSRHIPWVTIVGTGERTHKPHLWGTGQYHASPRKCWPIRYDTYCFSLCMYSRKSLCPKRCKKDLPSTLSIENSCVLCTFLQVYLQLKCSTTNCIRAYSLTLIYWSHFKISSRLTIKSNSKSYSRLISIAKILFECSKKYSKRAQVTQFTVIKIGDNHYGNLLFLTKRLV